MMEIVSRSSGPSNDNAKTLYAASEPSAAIDVLQERWRLVEAGVLPDPNEQLPPRDRLVRSAAMMILRIEAMDRDAARGREA